MKSKMTERHKLMAYVLKREFGYNMTDIAKLMKVSQSTISMSIKEVDYWRTIRNLQQELNDTRQLLIEKGFDEPQIFDADDSY